MGIVDIVVRINLLRCSYLYLGKRKKLGASVKVDLFLGFGLCEQFDGLQLLEIFLMFCFLDPPLKV